MVSKTDSPSKKYTCSSSIKLDLSKRLLEFDYNEKKAIISNTSRAICLIDQEAYELLRQFKGGKTARELGPLDKEAKKTIEEFVRGNILIPEDVDEDEVLRQNIGHLRTAPYANYVFVLTEACNLRCTYCYETKNPSHMSLETAHSIIDFIVEREKEKKSRLININFYGGEPLLNKDLMEPIFQGLRQKIPKEVKMDSQIITNGTLLTEDVADTLKRIKCNSVQITIDGPREVHNIRRPYASGEGSFDDVVKGLSNVTPKIEKGMVAIRVNIDKLNAKEFPKLVDFLERNNLLKKNVAVGPGRVTSTTPSNKAYNLYCLSPSMYGKVFFNIVSFIVKKGLVLPLQFSKFLYCSAFTDNTLIFDPNGNMFTCLGGVGRKEFIVGNIFNNPPFDDIYHEIWLKRSPLQYEKCRKCDIVGFCGAGCIDEAFAEFGDFEKAFCPYYKTYFKDAVIEHIKYTLHLMDERQKGKTTNE